MFYYNYDKNQMLILDQEEPEVILYQFNHKMQVIDQKKLDILEVLEIGKNREWSLI